MLALPFHGRKFLADDVQDVRWGAEEVLGRQIGQWYVLPRRREAIADYDKAIELEPKNAKHPMRRGMVNAVSRNPVAAIADFSAAIALDKNLAEAYELRAKAYEQRGAPGDAAKAAADRKKAAELSKSAPEAPPAPAP